MPMTTTHRTSPRILCLVLFVSMCALPGAARGIDFLVPGVSLASVSFDPGARVRYLVTSTVEGVTDSSEIELAVLACHADSVLLEIVSAPVPEIVEETVTVRLRLDRRVTSVSTPDEFEACIGEILIREGAQRFRRPTAEEIADYEFERMFPMEDSTAVRRKRGTERVETAAGVFDCTVVEISKRVERPVTLGGIEAKRVEEEVSTVWLSDEIPFWGMVGSRVEHRRETKLPAGSPRMLLEPRETTTASMLVHYER